MTLSESSVEALKWIRAVDQYLRAPNGAGTNDRNLHATAFTTSR
jgi:hypothetical protein